MTGAQCCPLCGADIPSDAPQGQCPKCLLQAWRGSLAGTSGIEPSPAPGAFVPPTVAELQPGFPQYELLELLGKGGMGAVYKARQPSLDRLVAIKILPPEVSQNPAFAERFTREARALARLSHAHIVAVYDFGRTLPADPSQQPLGAITPHAGTPGQPVEFTAPRPGNPNQPYESAPPRPDTPGRGEGGAGPLFYFVMEFVDGVNLRQALRAGAIHPKEALAIVPQICEALQFAHDEGVVHRDIKPENILIDKRGRVKIADFGLAKLIGQDVAGLALTGSQQVMGTLRYMAPEQMERAKEVDHRADIFSLGVVFYELLTGELPVGRFAPPSNKVQVDVRLDEVVMRALENEPARRYQHANEVKTAIEEITVPQSLFVPQPGGVPGEFPPGLLPRLMATTIGGLIGGLTMAVGVALVLYAVLSESPQSGQFWGWLGGAFGCFFGGGGALIGVVNTYRQIVGRGDLMTSPRWNCLDSILAGYAALGGVSLVVALAWSPPAGAARYSLLLLAAIVIGQAALFGIFRAPYRRAAKSPPANRS